LNEAEIREMPKKVESIVCLGGVGRPLMADATRWGDLLFLSGRAPVEPGTLELRADDFASQAEAVLDDVAAVLAACDSSLEHVLRVDCYLADPADFAAWNEVFAARFPSSPPARTTLVTGFAVEGMLVEVEVVAGVPS
jgi:2-iminobutanoate/2-iminopropanoate deaminase